MKQHVLEALRRSLDELDVESQYATARATPPAAAHNPHTPGRNSVDPGYARTYLGQSLLYTLLYLCLIPQEKTFVYRLGSGRTHPDAKKL